MACHLLKNGWTSDEVNARLGHTPNSTALRAYINYLALDRHKPKNRMHQSSVQEMQQKLHVSQLRGKELMDRYDQQQEKTEQMMQELEQLKSVVGRLIQSVAEAKVSA